MWGNGRLEADQVDISAKLAGRVRSIAVSEGDTVRPGQVIAELEAAFDKAQAETALGQEHLAEAQALVL